MCHTAAKLPLDILVNNAGTMQYFDLTAVDAKQQLDAELSLHLHTPIYLAMALVGRLIYARSYAKEPASRDTGFLIQVVATLSLLLGATGGVIVALYRATV